MEISVVLISSFALKSRFYMLLNDDGFMRFDLRSEDNKHNEYKQKYNKEE